jgi:hypothetical protein
MLAAAHISGLPKARDGLWPACKQECSHFALSQSARKPPSTLTSVYTCPAVSNHLINPYLSRGGSQYLLHLFTPPVLLAHRVDQGLNGNAVHARSSAAHSPQLAQY